MLSYAGPDSPEIPVAVHCRGAPTMSYAAASWYADVCGGVLVQDTSSKPSSPGLLNDSMGVVKVSITHSWRS